MNRFWLSLLLIMPTVCGAEESALTPAAINASTASAEPAASTETIARTEAVADAPAGIATISETAIPAPETDTKTPEPSKTRPTLVEKLKSQEAAAPRHPSPAWSNMLLGLGGVLAMIFGLAWLTKRLRVRVPGMAEQMRIVEAVNLGPREKLCIVVVDGKRLLLGVTQHSITVLNSSEDDKKKDESEAMFSEKIKKMLQNGTPNGR